MRLASKPACQVNKIPASATPYRGLGEFRFRRDELLVVEETGVLPDAQVCAGLGLPPQALHVWLDPGAPQRT